MKERGRKDPDPSPEGDDPHVERSLPKFAGSDILSGENHVEVLRKVLDGDPLKLRDRSSRRLRQRSYFISHRRVFERSAARIAHAALNYKGKPALGDWIERRIDDAINDLLREDWSRDKQGIPSALPHDPDYIEFAELLGAPEMFARGICVTFNALPKPVRDTVFWVAIENKRLNRWVALGNGPPAKAKAMLKRGIQALMLFEDDGGPGGPISPDRLPAIDPEHENGGNQS